VRRRSYSRSERSLFETGSNSYVGCVKLLAKVIREPGSRLWDRVTNDETMVAGLGDPFREKVVSHLRTHAPQADEADALCSRERHLTENGSGRPHSGTGILILVRLEDGDKTSE